MLKGLYALPSSAAALRESVDNASSLFSGDEFDEEFELLVNAYLKDLHHLSLSQAALNIAYATVNVCIVALPFIAQEAGIALFVPAMTIAALVSAYTSIMVICMASQQRVRTLEDLAERAFGPRGFFAVSVFQILFSVSLMCVTLQVWADITRDSLSSLGANQIYNRGGHRAMVLLGAVSVLPLCLFKKSLSSLRWTSYLTVFAVLSALLAVVATYISDSTHTDSGTHTESVEDVFRPKSLWYTIAFLSSFVFSSNQKVLTIYSSLRRRSTQRWQTAVTRSLCGVLLLYLLFAIAGYFAKSRQHVVLDSFNFFAGEEGEKSIVFNPARILVAVSLLLTIPVDCLVATTTWRRLRTKYLRSHTQGEGDGETGAHSSSYKQLSHAHSHTGSHTGSHTYTHSHTGSYSPPLSSQSVSARESVSEHSVPLLSESNENGEERTLPRAISPSLSPSHSQHALTQPCVCVGDTPSEASPTTAAVHSKALRETERDSLSHAHTLRETDSLSGSDSLSDSLSLSHSERERESQRERYDCHFNSYPRESSQSNYVRSHPFRSTVQSVEDPLLEAEVAEEEVVSSPWPTYAHAVPTLVLWSLCLGVSLVIQHWLYIVATIGTLSVISLMFLFPAALYFRLGLLSDFQAKPVFVCVSSPFSSSSLSEMCSTLVPNRLYMSVIALLGVMLLVFDVLACVCFVLTDRRLAMKD